MATYKSIGDAVETTIKEIEKSVDIRLYSAIAMKTINENYVPFETGQLKSSVRMSIKSKYDASLSWDTPYANRRYFENYKNPSKTLWFEQFESKNMDEILEELEKNLDKNIT